jgi:hypothetical protein
MQLLALCSREMRHHSIKPENKNHPQNGVSINQIAWELDENLSPIPMLYFTN